MSLFSRPSGRLTSSRRRVGLLPALLGLPFLLQAQTPPDTAKPAPTAASADSVATVVGTVVTTDGQPIVGADVILQGTARRVRTGADGRFAFTGLREGAIELLVRKLGYDPVEGPLFVTPGKQYALSLTMTPRGQLSRVVVSAQLYNEIYGVVVDSLGQPMGGATVEIGGERRVVTGRDGAFLFTDVAPGKWLVRASRPGFVPRVVGIQMVAQVERNLTIKLTPPDGSDVIGRGEESAWQEHGRRRAFTVGTGAALLTREDLARFGDQPLDRVVEAAAPVATLSMLAPLGRARGPSTFGNSIAGNSARLAVSDAACLLFDGTNPQINQPLRSVSANQLEAVEIFPPNTEMTRTACSRFPANSACFCGSEFATSPIFVLWTKR